LQTFIDLIKVTQKLCKALFGDGRIGWAVYFVQR